MDDGAIVGAAARATERRRGHHRQSPRRMRAERIAWGGGRGGAALDQPPGWGDNVKKVQGNSGK